MKKRLSLIFSSFLLITACRTGSGEQKSADHPDAMVGQWRNEMIRITMYTARNSSDPEIFEANRDNWEEQLGIQPILTTFNKEGDYYSTYKNLSDSVIREVHGKWYLTGDSIYMDQLRPEKERYVYHIVLKNDLAKFTSVLDWDEDGKKDDIYFGIQKKIKKK